MLFVLSVYSSIRKNNAFCLQFTVFFLSYRT
nr:MAG TPA: hypothetical protein [Crassvirales sp.]